MIERTFQLSRHAAVLFVLSLAACGGGNPLDNPPDVDNPLAVNGQKLSFAYFQKCIDPILQTPLQSVHDGVTTTNTCAGSGCHDTVAGTGGALRVVAHAPALDLADPANSPEVIRASDMYKNFYSAMGSTVIGSPLHSRLLAKPLLLNVLHGGGLIFDSEQDPNARRIAYWISRPVPNGQDEFSAASNSMFTPPDAGSGTCNSL